MEKFDVICIGAALIDIVASVDRHPLEDDEVFVSKLKLICGGAAANTATACSNLGLKTAFIGKLGYKDTYGKKIIQDFKNNSINTKLIKFSKELKTGSTYIALNSEGDRRIYAHSGAANYLTKEDIKEEELLYSKVIFLSSLKNFEGFSEAGKIGKKNNIPVILNPGMLIIDQGFLNIKELLETVDILILSKREYETLNNITEINYEHNNYIEINEKFWNLNIKAIVITLGEDGALLLTKKNKLLISSTKINHVIDTTGAGDAFSAGFIYGFLQNSNFDFDNLIKNVKIGNFIATKCIQELGARNGFPSTDQIKEFYDKIK